MSTVHCQLSIFIFPILLLHIWPAAITIKKLRKQTREDTTIQDLTKKRERAVLAGLAASSMPREEQSTEESMAELAALLDTAGGDAVAMVLQNRQTPDPRSFLGGGKLLEIKELIQAQECDLAVIDNELSPSQARVM